MLHSLTPLKKHRVLGHPSSSPDIHSAVELCQGSIDEVRGHREVSSERIGQPVSYEEDKILFPGLSCKTHSLMALTLLADSQVVTTKCSSLDVAFNFRCPSGFSCQRLAESSRERIILCSLFLLFFF